MPPSVAMTSACAVDTMRLRIVSLPIWIGWNIASKAITAPSLAFHCGRRFSGDAVAAKPLPTRGNFLAWIDHKQAIVVALFRTAIDLLGHSAQCAALGLENLIHSAGKPAGEHVVDLAPAFAVDVDEGRVLELHRGGPGGQVDGFNLEQPPAALRQTLHVVLEHRHARQAMALSLFLAPVPGGLVAGLVEDLGIGLSTQYLFDTDVVVDEEMPRHIEHRQCVSGPDAGFVVDLDRHFGDRKSTRLNS